MTIGTLDTVAARIREVELIGLVVRDAVPVDELFKFLGVPFPQTSRIADAPLEVPADFIGFVVSLERDYDFHFTITACPK